ncbi:hypothetical protein EP331_06425 [bacterium]|nr:MAG: hypothetical protein EP331_06425 [bacterium]
MKLYFITLLVLLSVFTLNTCNDYNDSDIYFLTGTSEVVMINYGTSFGMCIEYCITNYQITEHSIVKTTKSWDVNIEPIIQTFSSNKDAYRSLLNQIDIPNFKQLKETYGCPDCADGGAEYVEFTFLNGSKKRVTFEYYNEPEVLSNLVNVLRTMRYIEMNWQPHNN